jgi:hypothetical protein
MSYPEKFFKVPELINCVVQFVCHSYFIKLMCPQRGLFRLLHQVINTSDEENITREDLMLFQRSVIANSVIEVIERKIVLYLPNPFFF